jgi:2-hydroxy-3-keto-5-methylthiopentenyl-1-phosphate phosphatase
VYPYKKIFLTPFEKAIISFADGTLSLEDIMNKVHERFGNGNKKVDIYKKCRKFFHEIFSKELGIAFRRQY